MNLVSVVMPAYNAASFIFEAIESVVLQTYSNWELIVVNDGSTDNTLEIAQNFAQKDNRIKIVSQQNQGETAARNTGLNAARGEYISFLDSDDFYFPNFLKKLVSKLSVSDCDTVYCGFVAEQFNSIVGEPYAEGNIVECMALKGQTIWINALMIKRSLINERCLLFTSGLKVCGDVDFILRLGVIATTQAVSEPLCFYRKNPGSITNTKNERLVKSDVLVRDNLIKYVEENYKAPNKLEVCAALKKQRNQVDFYYQRRLWNAIRQKKFDVVLQNIEEFGQLKENLATKHRVRYAIRNYIINTCNVSLWWLVAKFLRKK